MKGKGDRFPFFVASLVLAVLVSGISAPWARAYDEEKGEKALPPRLIMVAPEYTGVVLPKGEALTLDLNVINRGRADENIEVSLTSIPEGWSARIKTYKFDVTGVHVPSDESKRLTLEALPGDKVGPGEYTFLIQAQTQDGELSASGRLKVRVEEKENEKKAKGIKLTTSYPVLRGPTDAVFEFSLEVENEIEEDTIFNLIAQGPKNWEVNFKPAYEDKFISSLRIKGGRTQTMAVEVRPFPLAEPDDYPLTVKVVSENAEAEAELMVVLTGTHEVEIGTAEGLLSLSALQGEEANLSFFVKNSGSALQNNVRFFSFKPENWKVTFEPENIESLPPGELRQVELSIQPAEQALVGDYSVGISVKGDKVSEDLEFRVSVKASTAWGWIGIGIIVLVIAGLVLLFFRMGRR